MARVVFASVLHSIALHGVALPYRSTQVSRESGYGGRRASLRADTSEDEMDLFQVSVSTVLGARREFATPPLQGVMKAKFSSNDYSGITSLYDSEKIEVYWNSEHSFYSWNAPFVEPQDGHEAETGWAQWLRPFVYTKEAEGGWHSRSYVGTRVDVVNHTSCCCQYLRMDNKDFRITEYCDIVNSTAGTLSEACAPFMVQPCPATNASAWQLSKEDKTRWNTKPYHESYDPEIRPLDPEKVPYLNDFKDGQSLIVTEVNDTASFVTKSSSVATPLVLCFLLVSLTWDEAQKER